LSGTPARLIVIARRSTTTAGDDGIRPLLVGIDAMYP
jgi:hypothetical protein